MDSTSDSESFLWEKASTGSEETDTIHKINGAENKNKLKPAAATEDDSYEAKKIKSKKRKQRENSFDEVESPKKKKIKTEPESDSDARKKKKKKSHMSKYDEDLNNSNEYLNMRVKQEQENLKSASKKNKKQRDTDFDNTHCSQKTEYDEYVPKKEKKSKKHKKHSSKDKSADSISENDLQNNENKSDLINDHVEEMDKPNKKSSKKKKNKESRISERYDSPDIEDKFSADETKVQNNHEHLNMTKTNNYNNYEPIVHDHSSHLEYSMEKTHTELNIHKPLEKQLPNTINNKTSVSIATLQNGSQEKKTSINQTVQSTPNKVQIQSKNTPSRLLDRICFEDDPDSDTDMTQDNNGASSFLKKYLKHNENLQQIFKGFQHVPEITSDDEIWILKCPHDIDVQKLHDTDFNLDSKSKIKINGETYCGNLDENESKITVMTSKKRKLILKNVVANGIIHFRKRLPKPHVQEDNYMVNNQTDFIPLPETKCRHPLFGSNYKDAIHVRVPRARVNDDVEVSTTHERKKKKKHKKDHSIKPKEEKDIEMSHEKSPKIENESDVPVKKVKKRKHTSNDESFKKKSKKIKLEPDSTEAWESEKAIEENLFNF